MTGKIITGLAQNNLQLDIHLLGDPLSELGLMFPCEYPESISISIPDASFRKSKRCHVPRSTVCEDFH